MTVDETMVIFCLQASCHEGSTKIEKAFILQLLGVDVSHNGKEVFYFVYTIVVTYDEWHYYWACKQKKIDKGVLY